MHIPFDRQYLLFLKTALKHELLTTQEVSKWAENLIIHQHTNDYFFSDLAMSSTRPRESVISLIEGHCGDEKMRIAGQALLGRLYLLLKIHQTDENKAVKTLAGMSQDPTILFNETEIKYIHKIVETSNAVNVYVGQEDFNILLYGFLMIYENLKYDQPESWPLYQDLINRELKDFRKFIEAQNRTISAKYNRDIKHHYGQRAREVQRETRRIRFNTAHLVYVLIAILIGYLIDSQTKDGPDADAFRNIQVEVSMHLVRKNLVGTLLSIGVLPGDSLHIISGTNNPIYIIGPKINKEWVSKYIEIQLTRDPFNSPDMLKLKKTQTFKASIFDKIVSLNIYQKDQGLFAEYDQILKRDLHIHIRIFSGNEIDLKKYILTLSSLQNNDFPNY